MKGKYEENKESIMKWRNNNKHKYNEAQLKYNHNNKEKCNEARLKRYYWAKISKIFRNILIE